MKIGQYEIKIEEDSSITENEIKLVDTNENELGKIINIGS